MTYPPNMFCSAICEYEWPEIDENAIAAKLCDLLTHLLRRMKKKNQNGRQIKMVVSDPCILQKRYESPQLDQIWFTGLSLYE